MRFLFRLVLLLSILTLLFGLLFKIMHWPGAEIMMIVGVAILILALLAGFILRQLNNKNEFKYGSSGLVKKSKKNGISFYARLVRLISIVATIFGALFKIQHWPGASILLTSGMCLLALSFIIEFFDKETNWEES